MTDAGSPIDSGRLLQTIGAYADNGPDIVQAKLVNSNTFDTNKRSGQLALFDVDGIPLRVSDAIIPDRVASGYYTSYPDGSYTTTATGAADRLFLSKVWLPPGTINELSCETTVAASAGGKLRMGIWNSSKTTGLPTTLVVDSGQVASDTAAGLKTLSVSAVIPKAGWYWIGVAAQVATCTMRMVSGGNSQIPKVSSGQSAISSVTVSSVTGAFSNNPVPTANFAGMPVLHIRWA